MVYRVVSLLIVAIAAASSSGAQGSGIFLQANASQGILKGDTLSHYELVGIGSTTGDSVHIINSSGEYTTTLGARHARYQYAVRFSFLAGYEKSFNKVLSLRGAVGYQYALLNADAATIPGYFIGDMTEQPFITSEIDRHWLNIPVDFKVTLPIRRSGLYVAAGPKCSILLSSKHTDSLTNSTFDLGDATPRFNFSLGFRFGAELAIARAGFLLIESGYHKGLLNLSPVSSANTQEGEFVPISLGFRMDVPPEKN